MPPVNGKHQDTPPALKPYVFHGLDFSFKGNTGQAHAECPFCGKGKFMIGYESGLWDCKVCGRKGNLQNFIRDLWEESDRTTSVTALDDLLAHRSLLMTETLLEWGAVQSVISGEWLLPGYDVDPGTGTKRLQTLYRYAQEHHNGTVGYRVWGTPGLGHQLYGVAGFNPKLDTVYVCEGPWDGAALWEAMRYSKWDAEAGPGRLTYTANPEASLLSEANVVAVPSTTVFSEKWLGMFAGKRVVLLFDNDHPRKHPQTGADIAPAGLSGMKRVAGYLANAEQPPAEIHYVEWGPGGVSLKLPDGCDVRDVIGASTEMVGRVACLQALLSLVKPIPAEWLEGRTLKARGSGGLELEPLPCETWRELVMAWRACMKWTEGLDRALSVMLASITSTRAAGDQLWVKVIGPAGCGKSTLCEAVTAARKYVKGVSSMRGFHSGFKSEKGSDKEDNSLLNQLRDKTLVTKDGDTLLQSPNLGQILSEARDIYDRVSRVNYRNKIDREYQGVNMTWLLCGTASLRSLDSSELGERFVDCVIMEGVDDDLEDEVLDRVAMRARKASGIQVNCKAESQHTPDMTRAIRLTMGYIDQLKARGIRDVEGLEWPDWAMRRLKAAAKFVSYMRARPSAKQDETVEREFSARLLSQYIKLAAFLAVVMNKATVDDEVLRRVRQTALDTARGYTLQLARHLYEAGEKGLEGKALAIFTGQTDEKTGGLLRFLERLRAVERHALQIHKNVAGPRRYRLTQRMKTLYEEVVLNGVPTARQPG